MQYTILLGKAQFINQNKTQGLSSGIQLIVKIQKEMKMKGESRGGGVSLTMPKQRSMIVKQAFVPR